MKCEICPRKCGVDRSKNMGVCFSGEKIKLAKAAPLFWEEPCISGDKGSGAIFFSGCNLKCCFCQNYQISHENFGKEVSIERFIKIIKELESKNVHNINLISPTHFSEQIIEALSRYKPSIPVVWNSNGYESVDTLKKLAGLVDVYLVDMKFADNNLAQELCHTYDYVDNNRRAVAEMLTQRPKIVLKDNVIQSGVIIRHLIMPNCARDSLSVLDYIATLRGQFDFLVSIMSQYVPCYKAKGNSLFNRKITPLERKIVIKHALDLGLCGFMQENESADECFIPEFNLDGV